MSANESLDSTRRSRFRWVLQEVTRRTGYWLDAPPRQSLRISPGSWRVLVILTAVLTIGLPEPSVLAHPPADRADGEAADKSEREPFTFQLNVVGISGTAVPDANVEIRTSPAPTADQIRRGAFIRAGNYGAITHTDSQGRLELTLPSIPQRFDLNIQQPGYGPYWAGWSNIAHPESIPPQFTAELEQGWTVGGVVVDASGQPVVGAKVNPSVYFKKRPGDTGRLGVGTRITTDAQGKWQYPHVPASMADVHIAIDHPEYQPLRRSLPRSGFEVHEGEIPSAQLELDQGLTVSGRVTDEAGEPIEGAVVRTKFLNDIRETKTDASGNYQLIGCEPKMAQVVVVAPGRAIDMQEVRIDSELKPVNFVMKPGGKVRIRVVDEQGQGIPKARIFFQRWRGAHAYFPFDQVNQYADENGVWQWDEAPLDEFRADICRPGGMVLSEQPLVAREDEYIFTPPKALVVSGRVVDAETGRPIEKFRVTPGLRNSNPSIGMNWATSQSYEATDGEYRIRLTHDYIAHLVQIEAEGYQVAISRDIMTDEGEIDIDFALRPAADIAATIVTAAGEPAAGAKIALGVHGSQISVKNGEIYDGSTYALQLAADAEGRFRIPARTEPFQIVITHSGGSAYLKSASDPIPDRITLTPWARVEGTFCVAAEPVAGVALTISAGIHSYGDGVPNIFTHHDVTTGEGGRFVFERVYPGKGRIGRRIMLMVDDGATEVTSAQQVAAEFTAGETTTLELGTSGRAVVGVLVPPDGVEEVLWNFALINVRADLTPLPRPRVPAEIQDDADKVATWWATVGQAWQADVDAFEQQRSQQPYFTASVDRGGRFRIDDMPPGSYLMSVRFDKQAAGMLTNYRFSVPAVDEHQGVDDAPTAEPIDLGQLQLEKL